MLFPRGDGDLPLQKPVRNAMLAARRLDLANAGLNPIVGYATVPTITKGSKSMWRKIGGSALMLFLVVTATKEISTQEVQWVPRSQSWDSK